MQRKPKINDNHQVKFKKKKKTHDANETERERQERGDGGNDQSPGTGRQAGHQKPQS